MSRLLLIGRGPLPGPQARQSGFSQQRSAHFLQALEAAGHRPRLLLLGEPGPHDPPEAMHLIEESPGWLQRGRALAEGADVLVSAGPYGPGLLAAAICGPRPWYADLPGDPLAELQAHAAWGPLPPARIAAAQAASRALLSRADALSAVSERQRIAALGQMALLGRVGDPLLAERVAVIPIAAAPTRAASPPATGARPRLALCGAANAWLDSPALCAGLDRAWRDGLEAELLITGGPDPSHPPETWARLQDLALAWPDRVRSRPWIPQQELEQELASCEVGLCLDRPGLEPLTGSRTRLLLYASAGLRILCSPGTELADSAIAAGLAEPLPSAPDALALALRQALSRPSRPDAPARRTAWLAQYAPLPTAAPLLRWLEAPSRAPGAEDALSAERAALLAELAALRGSPTLRLLNRLHRLLR